MELKLDLKQAIILRSLIGPTAGGNLQGIYTQINNFIQNEIGYAKIETEDFSSVRVETTIDEHKLNDIIKNLKNKKME